jgi:prepilin-type N-terminal cleavage/methylation domain-containing protein
MRVVTRLRDERGFTMVELLAVMLIGGIVMAGVTALIQTVMRESTRVVARTDASQRGRLVMDRMTRELRSQVCLDLGYESARPALESADRNQITFFTDLSNPDTVPTPPPVKRQLVYEEANKRIVEREFPMTSAAGAKPTTFSNTPSRTTILLQNVTAADKQPPPAEDTNPATDDFFSYRKYDGTGTSATDTLPVSGETPLSSADLAAVARITIAMDVRPGNAKDAAVFTRLEDSVLIRNLNKNPDYSPLNAKALLCE